MFTRKFLINTIPVSRKIFIVTKIEKYYFNQDYDIFYFKQSNSFDIQYGMRIECAYKLECTIDLDEILFNRMTESYISKISKTIFVLQLEEDQLLPITVFEIHDYNDITLKVAYVNFETERLSETFKIPNWFGEEVTDNISYSDMTLAFGVKNIDNEIITNDPKDEIEPDIYMEAIQAEIKRNNQIGTFNERLQKVARHKPKSLK